MQSDVSSSSAAPRLCYRRRLGLMQETGCDYGLEPIEGFPNFFIPLLIENFFIVISLKITNELFRWLLDSIKLA